MCNRKVKKENMEFQISPEEGGKYLRYGYGGGIHTAASGFACGLHFSLDELKCDCEYIESCRGGCRYRAELFGDPFGKDLDRCAFYGILK